VIGRILFSVLMSLATSTAWPPDGTIGEVSLKLPPPQGYCDLSKKERADAQVLEATTAAVNKVGNELLAMSADCGELTALRKGTRRMLDKRSQYQTTSDAAGKTYTPDVIKETCSDLRSQGAKMISDDLPGMRKAVEESYRNTKLNETRFIGVLGEDATACYAALMAKFRFEGKDVAQVVVLAMTVVKAKQVFYYLMWPYQNADTPTAMLSKHKANVPAFLAANK